MPNSRFRRLICARSRAGKTKILLDMIYRLRQFNKIYLYSKKFEQSKYRNLIKKFDPISRGVGYVAEISNDEIIPTKIKSFIEILFYNYFISLSI